MAFLQESSKLSFPAKGCWPSSVWASGFLSTLRILLRSSRIREPMCVAVFDSRQVLAIFLRYEVGRRGIELPRLYICMPRCAKSRSSIGRAAAHNERSLVKTQEVPQSRVAALILWFTESFCFFADVRRQNPSQTVSIHSISVKRFSAASQRLVFDIEHLSMDAMSPRNIYIIHGSLTLSLIIDRNPETSPHSLSECFIPH